MRILQKAREVLTGITAEERKQQKSELKVLRKDVHSAQYKQQKEEAIKYAIAAEKHKYEQKLKRLKQPKQPYNPKLEFGDMFGKVKLKGGGSGKRFNIITGRWE